MSQATFEDLKLLLPSHLSAVIVRARSHYGRPYREAVGLSGQTSLRVRRNGLQIIANKI